MELAQTVTQLGGVVSAAELKRITTAHQLRRAVAAGELIRVSRGHYSLPDLEANRRAASTVNGALDRLSAAHHWGWKIKLPPEKPQVIVPRGRKVPTDKRAKLELRWGSVSTAELEAGVTSPERTALECARTLPFDAALAVVDSALRAGMSRGSLLLACARLPRTGRSHAYRVIESATRLAANPFESVLRAIVMDIPEAQFRPQVWVGNIGRADLVDERRRLVLEADSFEFHANTAAFAADMARYNAFICAGYLVLRFAWKHVMFEPDYVREVVRAVIATDGLSVRRCASCAAA